MWCGLVQCVEWTSAMCGMDQCNVWCELVLGVVWISAMCGMD